MYVIHAPAKRFGILPPAHNPICNEVKFYGNIAFCPTNYWKKIHTNHGFLDITPKELVKIRKERRLKNIVLFATGGIGDSLWIMPVAKALRQKHPQAVIAIVVDKQNVNTWKHCPFISGVVENEVWNVQGLMQKADEVYDFGGLATVYKNLMKLEPVEATFKVAELDLPKDRADMRPYIQLTAEEGLNAIKILKENGIDPYTDKIISFGIEASTSNRNYPYSSTAKASDLLQEQGFKIVWLGKTKDLQNEDVTKAAEKKNILNLSGKTSLRMAWAIISISDLYIGPNSSNMVVATSLNVPTVGLFGAFDPHRIGKYYDKFMGMWGKLKCSPCNEHWTECRHGNVAPCMRSITPESVAEKALFMTIKYPRSKDHVLPTE